MISASLGLIVVYLWLIVVHFGLMPVYFGLILVHFSLFSYHCWADSGCNMAQGHWFSYVFLVDQFDGSTKTMSWTKVIRWSFEGNLMNCGCHITKALRKYYENITKILDKNAARIWLSLPFYPVIEGNLNVIGK